MTGPSEHIFAHSLCDPGNSLCDPLERVHLLFKYYGRQEDNNNAYGSIAYNKVDV